MARSRSPEQSSGDACGCSRPPWSGPTSWRASGDKWVTLIPDIALRSSELCLLILESIEIKRRPCRRRSAWQKQVEQLHGFRPVSHPNPALKKYVLLFLLLLFTPIAVSAANYWRGERRDNWQMADRSSAGLLPKPSEHADAMIRVFAARTVRWRGIFAVHSWIVVKERGASRYSRYDYTAWGNPIRVDGFVADGRWFGAIPETILSVDGERAEVLIPKIRGVVENYRFQADGDYNAWPGPNSNTFVQAVLDSVPELDAVLPPTAIGKDYPYRGKWFGLTASGTGAFVSLGGYFGLTIGWVEGVELNFLGGVLGVDLRRPALKFPGIGRVGWPVA